MLLPLALPGHAEVPALCGVTWKHCSIVDLLPASRWVQPSLGIMGTLSSLSSSLSLYPGGNRQDSWAGAAAKPPLPSQRGWRLGSRLPHFLVSRLNCLLSAPLSYLGPTLTQSQSGYRARSRENLVWPLRLDVAQGDGSRRNSIERSS
jgi:hypothetical protein